LLPDAAVPDDPVAREGDVVFVVDVFLDPDVTATMMIRSTTAAATQNHHFL